MCVLKNPLYTFPHFFLVGSTSVSLRVTSKNFLEHARKTKPHRFIGAVLCLPSDRGVSKF